MTDKGKDSVTSGKQASIITEEEGDLFSVTLKSGVAIGHCVSQCYRMGKGIAVEFRKRFGGVADLLEQRVPIGGIGVLKRNGGCIYYLVTKERYFHKPTLRSIQGSINAMRDHAVEHKVHHIALPRIGCGLDRLHWPTVKSSLVSAFAHTGIHISIYYSIIEPFGRSAPPPTESKHDLETKTLPMQSDISKYLVRSKIATPATSTTRSKAVSHSTSDRDKNSNRTSKRSRPLDSNRDKSPTRGTPKRYRSRSPVS